MACSSEREDGQLQREGGEEAKHCTALDVCMLFLCLFLFLLLFLDFCCKDVRLLFAMMVFGGYW